MIKETDSIKQFEEFKLRIKEKGIIHQSLLGYLGLSTDEINQKTKKEGKTEEIFQILKNNNISTNKCEFREFLEIISHLWEMHESKEEMKYKVESLFKILKEDIKNIFSEKEIFSIFLWCPNRLILLILIEQNIISIETIIKNIKKKDNYNYWDIIKYLYPEIRKWDKEYYQYIFKLKKFVEENDQNLEFFYEIRKKGEKKAKIVELIKEDKIEEFISFIEHFPIDLNKKIEKEETIFYTDKRKLTPIEYSVLFGSLAIFKYLYKKNINIIKYNSNIIEYAIEGRNYEIIHLLEEKKGIIRALNNQELQHKYLEISIKIHYNEIYEYLMSNYNIQVTEEIIYLVIIYRNYQLLDQLIERNQIELNNKAIISNIFRRFCENGNEEIVKMLINQPNLDINLKDDILVYFL